MIKNILIRRKESDTYLATVRRHRWSLQVAMSSDSSQVGVSLSFLLINIFFIMEGTNTHETESYVEILIQIGLIA